MIEQPSDEVIERLAVASGWRVAVQEEALLTAPLPAAPAKALSDKEEADFTAMQDSLVSTLLFSSWYTAQSLSIQRVDTGDRMVHVIGEALFDQLWETALHYASKGLSGPPGHAGEYALNRELHRPASRREHRNGLCFIVEAHVAHLRAVS
jgi:hypothetical protein